ncbi:hypothetical protein, partial [Deinococcus fonticola]|uniref:hypothetical protein n=1 Tax=Deinococcus fonticola TaxID=2528713 RepID=UPI0014306D52
LALNDELTFGVDNGEIPRLFTLLAYETVPLIGLHARDLKVTSVLIMELLSMNPSATNDSSNGRAMTVCENRSG